MNTNHQHTQSGEYLPITHFESHFGSSSHTRPEDFHNGRTMITTEASVVYNALRNFLGLESVDLNTVGKWAFANDLTNNDMAYGRQEEAVGLYYQKQGATIGWTTKETYQPDIIAKLIHAARSGDTPRVLEIVKQYGKDGLAEYLVKNNLVEPFARVAAQEMHSGGIAHGSGHGDLIFQDENGNDVATAHDLNHAISTNPDNTETFANDTQLWPQWDGTKVPDLIVYKYYESMILLSDPGGRRPSSSDDQPAAVVTPEPVIEAPYEMEQAPKAEESAAIPQPATQAAPSKPIAAEQSAPQAPVATQPAPNTSANDGSAALDAQLVVRDDWGDGSVVMMQITNTSQTAINGGWNVELDFNPALVENNWNGVLSNARNGEGIKVSNADYNGFIGAGQTIEVGFQLNEGSLNPMQLNQDADIMFV